tara:strand:- start:309 stop:548 length:240 start_codon:yes stop_codon:yes gene_type:complete
MIKSESETTHDLCGELWSLHKIEQTGEGAFVMTCPVTVAATPPDDFDAKVLAVLRRLRFGSIVHVEYGNKLENVRLEGE